MGKKWWFWVLVVIGIILIIAFFRTTGQYMSNKLSEIKQEYTQSNNERKNYQIGETYKDSKISIKLVEVNENYTNYNEYANIKEGHKVIKATFEFECIGSSDVHVSEYDFYCYADNYNCERFLYVDDDLSATLSQGKKTQGNVYFEVPKSAESIVLEYELNMWTDERVEFKLK